MRTVTNKATAVVNYNHATIAKKLHALYNMRTAWFMQTGINRPEPKLLYAVERLGMWIPKCTKWTAQNLYNKVAACQADIKLILPSATGKQSKFRAEIENYISFCIANKKEVKHDTTN